MLGSSLPPSLSVNQSSHLCAFQAFPINARLKFYAVGAKNIRRTRPTTTTAVFQSLSSVAYFRPSLDKPKSSLVRTVVTRVTNEYEGSGASADPTSQVRSSLDSKEVSIPSSTLGDGYISLFVRMLGVDNDPLDREQAIIALWKYSLGGKKFVDNIMQFPGCINLTVNLLRSESDSTCEAAAGLLRSISAINVYKDLVAESGAIEEITALLFRPSLISEVKEQSICTLWNLSVDGKWREKIAKSDILPILVKCLDDEDIKVVEAAGGVLANLALSQINHSIMVEEGVIPKLAKFLKYDAEGSKVIIKEARNALLELSKDEYHRILIIEQGLILVPLIGAEAYKSFSPGLHTWPTLPDGTMIERGSQKPSRFGASELLLGLNIDEKSTEIGEAKVDAILGRTRQQFLARIGAIELDEDEPEKESEGGRFTLLPSVDGIARLVLILGLDNEVAISRAAGSIADACIDEEMRMGFREAGAVRHLVRLLGYNNDIFLYPVVRALEKLSISHTVCQVIEAEGVVDPLFDILKRKDISENLTSKTLDILARILDPNKEMRSKFNEEQANGLNTRTAADLAEKDEEKDSKRDNVVNSSAVQCLVEILKSSPPNLQRKVASILDFIAMTEPITEMVSSADIEAALLACFRQRILEENESDLEANEPEKYVLETEEAGLAISAAARLLSTLLDSEHFVCHLADPQQISESLRLVLKAPQVPLRCKDWVAACLVKLTSLVLREPSSDSISAEVALYETAPRLISRLEEDGPAGEEAAAELHRMVSEGVVDPTRAVAANGGIEPLVRMLRVDGRAVEAALGILYSLAMEVENRPEIVAAGAVPHLKRIVLAKRPQWTKALLLLRTLPT